MSVKCIPLKPHFYIEKLVCRGIPIFLIFDPKHTLWVIVFNENFLIKQLQMGRHILRHHIWGYSVCLCPIKGTLGLNELIQMHNVL